MSMAFILLSLKNVKMSTVAGILSFINGINTPERKSLFVKWAFYAQLKLRAHLKLAWKAFRTEKTSRRTAFKIRSDQLIDPVCRSEMVDPNCLLPTYVSFLFLKTLISKQKNM